MDIPPQNAFLYTGSWNPQCDVVMVQCLIKLKAETQWTKANFPTWFMLTVCEELRSKMGVVFSEGELHDRAEVLRRRYNTVKEILRYPGAWWDFPRKKIVVPAEEWVIILKEIPFAGAYYHNEEPIYSQLACLFGLEDVKVEHDNDIIILSDTIEVETEELPNPKSSEPEDEVNSPIVFPPPTVRRKLFYDDYDAKDMESTTELEMYFVDLASDGQMRTMLEKGRVLPKHPNVGLNEGGPSTASQHASSCGSNSPMGCWPHPRK